MTIKNLRSAREGPDGGFPVIYSGRYYSLGKMLGRIGDFAEKAGDRRLINDRS